MRPLFIVMRKEITDNLRDRRTLWSALVFGPLFGPLLFSIVLSASLTLAITETDESLEVPIVGAEHAPNLVQFLRQNNCEILPAPESPESAVRDRRHNLVLVIPETFGENFTQGEPAAVRLVTDQSNRKASRKIVRARQLLNAYGQKIGAMRLQARGVSPLISYPLVIEDIDVSTATGRSVLVLGLLTYFVLFAMLSGGFYLAIDATAGERERGSLEPLLTLPAPRSELLLGKLGATCAFMTLSLAITLVAFSISLRLIPLEELGMSANFRPDVVARIFLVALPFVLLGAALMTTVATFTKSYKEAQSYLTIVLLVPTVPIIFAGIYELEPNLWLMTIPSLSQHLLITELIKANSLDLLSVSVSVASTVLFGLALTYVAARLYDRERILG